MDFYLRGWWVQIPPDLRGLMVQIPKNNLLAEISVPCSVYIGVCVCPLHLIFGHRVLLSLCNAKTETLPTVLFLAKNNEFLLWGW